MFRRFRDESGLVGILLWTAAIIAVFAVLQWAFGPPTAEHIKAIEKQMKMDMRR